MTDIMELVKQYVSLTLEMPIDDNDITYLDKNWHSWLHDMGGYSNLTPMVKADLLENKN